MRCGSRWSQLQSGARESSDEAGKSNPTGLEKLRLEAQNAGPIFMLLIGSVTVSPHCEYLIIVIIIITIIIIVIEDLLCPSE